MHAHVYTVALACLTDLQFGPWALEAWPKLADDVLAGSGSAQGHSG